MMDNNQEINNKVNIVLSEQTITDRQELLESEDLNPLIVNASIQPSPKQTIQAAKIKVIDTKAITDNTVQQLDLKLPHIPIIAQDHIQPIDIISQQQIRHTHNHVPIENYEKQYHLATYREYPWLVAQQDVKDNNDNEQAKIVIIIDDLGINYDLTKKAIALDPRITLSFLPYGRHSRSLAREASMFGHDILLHLPMEPESIDINPGINALHTNMDSQNLQAAITWNLEQFKGFIGVNNHMGSKFTQWQSGMEFLFNELKHRDLFFVDSVTTVNSQAFNAAKNKNLDIIRRDIFLDHHQDRDSIIKQFKKLENIAIKQGYAVAIAHPYDTTLTLLQQWLQSLSTRNDITLVNMKVLWQSLIQKPLPKLHQNAKNTASLQKISATPAATQNDKDIKQLASQIQRDFKLQTTLALTKASDDESNISNALTLDGYQSFASTLAKQYQHFNINNERTSALIPRIKKLTGADLPARQSQLNTNFLNNYDNKKSNISINNIVNW